MTIKEISNAIDDLHAKSLKAIANKDILGYMSVFSNDLKYIQSNGEIFNKEHLARNQDNYFSRIKSVESHYERIACTYDSKVYTETLIQKARISIRVFIFFKKKWNVERKGIYRWMHLNGEWKIISVNILNEKIT